MVSLDASGRSQGLDGRSCGNPQGELAVASRSGSPEAPKRELEELILEEVRASGPITVARFMELALYHPAHGYYSRGPERSSRKGHFVTSPEIGAVYGRLWCKGFEEIWHATGAPDEFTVAEVGPGEGSFIAAVLAASKGPFRDALQVHLIERIPALRRRQEMVLGDLSGETQVTWHEDLTGVPPRAAGCVFANEVLDNVPVHVVVGTPEGPSELYVAATQKELTEELGPLSPEVVAYAEKMPALLPGARIEIRPQTRTLLADAASALEQGAIIIVDYGDEAAALASRSGGTLVCYSRNGTDDAFLRDVGHKDITAHVDWSALRRDMTAVALESDGPRLQRDVLRSLGTRALEERLRNDHDQAVAAGDGAQAFRALATRQSLATLTDEGGLGGLGVMMGTKGLPRPLFSDEGKKNDRPPRSRSSE